MRIIRSKQNKALYLYQGFRYSFLNSGRIRCSSKSKCSGLAQYRDGIFHLLTEHKCKPNIGYNNGLLAKENMKEAARNSTESSRQIVRNSLITLTSGIFLD